MKTRIFPFLLFCFITAILTSCDVSYSSSGSITRSWINGDGYKKITVSVNGNEKKLVANQAIVLEGGTISGYKEGLLIELSEEREGTACKAELKEVDGVLKLFCAGG